jgi:hypothetical protein
MAQVRTIEEFIKGPDGRADRGLRPTIEDLLNDDRLKAVEKVQVRCVATPAGTNSDRVDWTSYFPVEASPDQIVEGIRRQLERSPGDLFSGSIRLNFYPMGNSSEYLTSFTRKMRPQISPDLVAQTGGLMGDLGHVSAHYEAMVKPVIDQQIRLLHACTGLVESAGKLVEAKNPKPVASDGSVGVMGDLLRGAVGIAGAADTPPAAQSGPGVPVGPMAVDSNRPPPSAPSSPAPSSPAPAASTPSANTAPPVDEAAVKAWLQANPLRAKAVGEDMLGKFGYKVVPS